MKGSGEHVVRAEYFLWDAGGNEENGRVRKIKSGKEKKEEDYYKERASPLCTDIATPDGFF